MSAGQDEWSRLDSIQLDGEKADPLRPDILSQSLRQALDERGRALFRRRIPSRRRLYALYYKGSLLWRTWESARTASSTQTAVGRASGSRWYPKPRRPRTGCTSTSTPAAGGRCRWQPAGGELTPRRGGWPV